MIILISNDTNKNYDNINDGASDRRWLTIAIILTRIGRDQWNVVSNDNHEAMRVKMSKCLW
ncbi:hypothetical protein V1478_017947 [Vespula squamosa]|uniref:Uncharacterized protein n=1 Tax=Vespula squamosa TaxID=30214 RepID=A0ABD1ZVM5_VESSQ